MRIFSSHAAVTMMPATSVQTASSHSSHLAWPPARPPATASAPLTAHQARIRSKFRCTGPRTAATVNMLRPTCCTTSSAHQA